MESMNPMYDALWHMRHHSPGVPMTHSHHAHDEIEHPYEHGVAAAVLLAAMSSYWGFDSLEGGDGAVSCFELQSTHGHGQHTARDVGIHHDPMDEPAEQRDAPIDPVSFVPFEQCCDHIFAEAKL